MKTFSLLLTICISSLITPQKISAQNTTVDFQIFYDELIPYGTWIDNPNYGYVWMPNVAAGFIPYVTNGNWVFTDEGWAWVSDYSWGWAPFHYGRWFTDPFYGPTWVPDYEWGPGWVTWRSSDDYFGWAPMSPDISFNMSFSNNYHIPNNDWRFVKSNGFGRKDMKNYYVNTSQNLTIINKTTIINNRRTDKVHNTSYNAGPNRREVEKHSGRTIAPIMINEDKTPGQSFNNGKLHMYRPEIKNDPNKAKPAPAKFTNVADATTHKPINVERIPQNIDHTSELQHNNPPAKHINPPVKQQTPQAQRNNPSPKQQAPQAQRNNPSPKQHAPQSQHNNPSPKQQIIPQPQHNNPPVKQQAPQAQRNNPSPKQPPLNNEQRKPPHED